jgi:GNAT superfamily N-acetyltransferase
MHVKSWQETYRGLMPDELLDSADFVQARERFWVDILAQEQFSANRVAVAERDGALIGIAMAGPVQDKPWSVHLYVLYVLAAHHGCGAGGALLDAVVAPGEEAALWVADPNPRAQAFYRKHGFVPDGISQVEDGVREIHMVRSARQEPEQV